MDDPDLNPNHGDTQTLTRESPQLVALLKEMKDGLDAVRGKVQALTQKVKQSQLPTADGMSYLEVKHLLLLGYCQSILYYLLRKAKGLSIEGHPVVRSLVEIRLFLEKMRPIDKKLEYQVQKLTRAAGNITTDKAAGSDRKEKEEGEHAEDALKYRPNPDMLISKLNQTVEDGGSVYRPPRFAPTSMDDDKISKQDKQATRREKDWLQQAKQSAFVKELMGDLEDRPEEVSEIIGIETKELSRYKAKREEQARQEEELFTRAPVTKKDKKIEKHMKKSRNGLIGLVDDFYDDVRTLLIEKEKDDYTGTTSFASGGKRFRKRKRKH